MCSPGVSPRHHTQLCGVCYFPSEPLLTISLVLSGFKAPFFIIAIRKMRSPGGQRRKTRPLGATVPLMVEEGPLPQNVGSSGAC